jgi:Ca2+-binding EF-hand superfamily protein
VWSLYRTLPIVTLRPTPHNAQLDADNNGSLSVQELNTWYFQVAADMKKTRKGNLTATASAAFKKFDKDGNGYV